MTIKTTLLVRVPIVKLFCGTAHVPYHMIYKKYVLWNAGICPIAAKVGHVTLATPPF